MWKINKISDIIVSNINYVLIKLLYSKFQGIYIFNKYSAIGVKYEYVIGDTSFYKNIEFKDYGN